MQAKKDCDTARMRWPLTASAHLRPHRAASHLRCATSEHANFGKGTFVTREYANLAVLAGACSFDAARQLVDAAKQVRQQTCA